MASLYDFDVFEEIKKNSYVFSGLLIFMVFLLGIIAAKILITYPHYKVYLLEQLDKTIQELRAKGATEEELEQLRHNALQYTTLPFLLITTLTVEFFRQPVALLIQALALLFVFLRFNPFAPGTFKDIFATLLYSKSAILLGGLLSIYIAYLTGNPSANFSPAILVGDEKLKSVLFHLDLFSLYSLYILSMGLVKGFQFKFQDALIGVYGLWMIFFITNIFYVYVKPF